MNDTRDYLALQFSILQWIGVFFPGDPSKRTAFYVYRTVVFAVISVTTVLMTVQMFVATDLTVLTRTIDIWTMFLSGLYKWSCMAAWSGRFAELNTALSRIQAQGSAGYGRSADRFTNDYLRFMHKTTTWYLMSGLVAAAFIVASPLLTYPRGNRTKVDYYNDPRSYPLCCWLPFEIVDDWIFYAMFVWHSTALMIVVLVYLGIDSYFFGSIYAVGGQIEMLNSSLSNVQCSITEVEKSSAENKSSTTSLYFTENQQIQCYFIVRECMAHHVLILNYIKSVQSLFSTLIIVDYLHGITSLSFALFQITISHGMGETISVMVFFLVSLWHQFLNNFFGDYIIQKQLSVHLTLYDVPWWKAGKKICQCLRLMILRSIRPTIISGYYMYNLNYESFVAFVKALYTYYMVLRRVNVENQLD